MPHVNEDAQLGGGAQGLAWQGQEVQDGLHSEARIRLREDAAWAIKGGCPFPACHRCK